MNISTEQQKQIRDRASNDWNEQCRRFMSGKIPFRDKTARKCYERHLRNAQQR